MTRAQIREKYGISMLESPSVANKELSEKEAAEYEDCVSLLLRTFDEIDENIEKFCSRCKYYRTAESDKCDSVIPRVFLRRQLQVYRESQGDFQTKRNK